MRKILLIAATTTTLLSSAASFADMDQFYIKAEAGATLLNKQTDKYSGLKMKAKSAAPIFGLGAGYYVMDNVRADLNLNILTNAELKKNGNSAEGGINYPTTAKHKPQALALMLNGYVELFDVSITKAFLGAGIGWAQVKEKITVTWQAAGSQPADKSATSTKKANNFAYKLIAGVSTEFAPGVKADLSYFWADYGKTKPKKDALAKTLGKTHLKGHNVTVGVRFDI